MVILLYFCLSNQHWKIVKGKVRASVILFFWSFTLQQAAGQSCCMKSATSVFAGLANNQKFVSSHLAPLPFTFSTERGKMITFKTSDGKEGGAFEVRSDKPTNNYVFMFHEWWGLNDYIKQEAEKLQKELGNVNILAIDLYDGKVAVNAEDAGKLMQGVVQKRAEAIIKGAISYSGKSALITTIGWCFGGGWSLQASILADKQGAGCVMYYGMPESDLIKLQKLNGNVLGIFASKDEWINTKVVKQFEQDMKTAGKELTVKTFEADHAFANPSNPKFNKEAAGEAHVLAVDFLRKRLK